jgi:hypothetical protein
MLIITYLFNKFPIFYCGISRHVNRIHSIKYCFFKILLNIIIRLGQHFPSCLFPSIILKKIVFIFHPTHVRYMFCPSYPSLLDHFHNTWWRIHLKNTKHSHLTSCHLSANAAKPSPVSTHNTGYDAFVHDRPDCIPMLSSEKTYNFV